MKKVLLFFLVLFSVSSFDQTVFTTLNKKQLALGEVGIYTLRIADVKNKPIIIAPKNELMPFHFEEVKDSISQGTDTYERIIEFAVYEEGKFTIPAFDLKVGDKTLKTIPYELEVVNTAQKKDQINDIMGNKDVKMTAVDYWEVYKFWLLGILALLALIFAIFMFIKYGRKRKAQPVVITNKTLRELENLRKKGYIESGNFRAFYVELLDLTRSFVTQQYHIPADVLLTDDLVQHMRNNHTISQENEKILGDVLTRGDMVKFAKIFPQKDTMTADIDAIKKVVKNSQKDLELENLRSDV